MTQTWNPQDRRQDIARRIRDRFEPARRWTATVTDDTGGKWTTIVHGPTPDEAARRYRQDHPSVTRVTLHAEQSR